jgi:hypothetical protein
VAIAASSIAYEPGSVADQLVTRTYKIDLSKLHLDTTNSPSASIRSVITNAGVAFPSGASIASISPLTKAMFLNDRTGELHIRASRREIPKIEKAIQPYWQPNIVAPLQLEIACIDLPQPNMLPILTTLGPSFTNVVLLTQKQRDTLWKNLSDSGGVSSTVLPAEKVRNGKTLRITITPQNDPPLIAQPYAAPEGVSAPSTDMSLIIRGQLP